VIQSAKVRLSRQPLISRFASWQASGFIRGTWENGGLRSEPVDRIYLIVRSMLAFSLSPFTSRFLITKSEQQGLLRHRVFGQQRRVFIVNSTVDNEDCMD
jgi:hypothetical protein